MAIRFGEDRTVDFAAGNLMTFAKSFSAMNGQPLDNREVWYDKAALEAAAQGTTMYVGQKVTFVDVENNKVYQYSVQLDGTLKEIGVAPIGDGATIAVDADGKVALYGVDGLDSSKTYVPSFVDGKLTWAEPDTSTAEGQQQAIDGLTTRMSTAEGAIDALEATVGDAEAGLVKDVADNKSAIEAEATAARAAEKANADAIDALEAKVGVDVDGETPATGLFKEIDDVAARVATIEGDYLKAADKTEVTGKIDTLTTTVSDMDTAYKAADKDLADRITALEGTTHFAGAGALSSRPATADDGDIYVATDSGKEYIWANGGWIELGDVTAEQERISTLESKVATAEGKITALETDKADAEHTHAITDVEGLETALAGKSAEGHGHAIDDVTGLQAALDAKADDGHGHEIADVEGLEEALAGKETAGAAAAALAESKTYAEDKVADATTTLNASIKDVADDVAAVDTRVEALEAVGSEKNVIAAVGSEFTVTEDTRTLGIAAIAADKVTGLSDALAGKVDKVTSDYKGEQVAWTLVSPENQEKLKALVIGESGVEISGTVNADNVEGLGAFITENRNSLGGLYPEADASKLLGIAAGAQVNVIETIKLNGVAASVTDKAVNIPMAGLAALGLVAGSNAENGIAVAADGTMSVNNLNVNKLVQTDGEEFIINGGNA